MNKEAARKRQKRTIHSIPGNGDERRAVINRSRLLTEQFLGGGAELDKGQELAAFNEIGGRCRQLSAVF